MGNGKLEELKRMLPTVAESVPDLVKKTANEMAGPCPKCGGDDRFVVFKEEGRFWCRQCDWKGDNIDMHRHLVSEPVMC